MSDDTSIQLDEHDRTALEEAGRSDQESLVAAAINDIARSHKGRPVDEVQSVLREAIRGKTGDAGTLPAASVERVARRIAESAPHA